MTEPISDGELAQLADLRRKEQQAEYGQFVAAQDILHDGALAYLKDAPVPVSNVIRHGYLANGLVVTSEEVAERREAEARAAADAAAKAQAEAEKAFREAVKPKKKQPNKPASPDPEK